MVAFKKCLREMLERIPDEKLSNLNYYEGTIYDDGKVGVRVDHQGINKDPNAYPYIHRLALQPIGGPKSVLSRTGEDRSSDNMIAEILCTENATPDEIRDALFQS